MCATTDDLPDELLAAICVNRKWDERRARGADWPPSISRRLSVVSLTARHWGELYIDMDWDAVTLANATQQILTRSENLSSKFVDRQSHRPAICLIRAKSLRSMLRSGPRGDLEHRRWCLIYSCEEPCGCDFLQLPGSPPLQRVMAIQKLIGVALEIYYDQACFLSQRFVSSEVYLRLASERELDPTTADHTRLVDGEAPVFPARAVPA
jgi:hypothetical protein